MRRPDLDVNDSALACSGAHWRAWCVTVAQRFGASARTCEPMRMMCDDGIVSGRRSEGDFASRIATRDGVLLEMAEVRDSRRRT